MLAFSGDLAALLLKLLLGTLAFSGVLWAARDANQRAIGMMLTFPALNGVVLLTVTDKVVSEMVIAIFPLMFFNGLLAAIFIWLRRKLSGRQWLAIGVCLLLWGAITVLLEWDALWPHRKGVAIAAAVLIVGCAAWAFRRLRRADVQEVAPPADQASLSTFLRDRAQRIFWFFVSFAIVSLAAYAWSDAHSLVGRLSALPLVPLFVLHWAVNERRVDLEELRTSALIGPVAAMGFLFLFAYSLSFIRTDAGALHPWYWVIGTALLLAEWELTRRVIVGLSLLTYRR
jgi:hypothetical protein